MSAQGGASEPVRGESPVAPRPAPLVSVIVPVYNVEGYLERCVQSILSQTLRDIELILVDDGSTDASGAICDAYAAHDERVVVLHQQNEGISGARNNGIDLARGAFFGFVDGDDYIEPDMYAYLYDLACAHDADIVQCGIINRYADEAIPAQPGLFEMADSETMTFRLLEARFSCMTVYNRIYRRELAEVVRFRDYRIAEDVMFAVETALAAKRMLITNEPKYNYVHRPGSATSKPFEPSMCDGIVVYETVYQKVAHLSPRVERMARMRLCYCRLLVLDKLYTSPNGYPRDLELELVRYLRRHGSIILFNDFMTGRRRVALAALMINRRLYRAIARAFYKRNRLVS